MFNIEKLLEKFSRNIDKLEFDIVNAINIIKSETGINLAKEDVEIKNYVLYIKCSPAIKNRIFISKQNILDKIKSITPNKILDLR
ncbi:MAG: hypothetical protein ABL917_01735 [Parcubacteria group bacterium]